MLSWALKVVWFALSLSGLASCWLIMVAFGHAARSYWGPILYSVGATILEGIFCIGMIWHMDPFRMPQAFCIAQTAIIGFAAFFMTGVCTAFSFATNMAVLNPKSFRDPSKGALTWNNYFLLPILVYPLIASAAQVSVILKFDAVHPLDDFHCDVSSPIWIRLLGYAGSPLILGIPCFITSLVTIRRALQMQKRIKNRVGYGRETRDNRDDSPNHLTALPQRRNSRRNTFQGIPPVVYSPFPTSPIYNTISGRVPISPGFASPILSARQFHLPFSPTPGQTSSGPGQEIPRSSRSSTAPDYDDPPSPASHNFPPLTHNSPRLEPQYRTHSDQDHDDYDRHTHTHLTPSGIEVYEYEYDENGHLRRTRTPQEWAPIDDEHRSIGNKSSSDRLSSLRWAPNTNSNDRLHDMMGTKSDLGAYLNAPGSGRNERRERDNASDEGFVVVVEDDYVIDFNYHDERESQRSARYPAPSPATSSTLAVRNLGAAIWRIILFQLSFCLVLCLAAISTLIDVIVNRPTPSTFGTHHVALLLAAWGPAFVFGHLPSVRHNLSSIFRWK